MKVIVTRPRGRSASLVEQLRALPVDVVECPLIETEPVSDEPIDGAGYDWVIVTSAAGAEELSRRGVNLPQIAAVGPGTADALRRAGLAAAFVPRDASQAGLLAELPRPAGRVLFAAAADAAPGPVEQLGADLVVLYRTRLLRPTLPDADFVLLASGSAARAYAAAGGLAPAVTIGPEMSRVARDAGLRVEREAVTHDVQGLVTAVRDLMESG